MKLEFPSIVDFGLDRAAEVLTEAFADYFVAITADAAALLHATRVDSVDLASSCIFVRDGAAVGGAHRPSRLVIAPGWDGHSA